MSTLPKPRSIFHDGFAAYLERRAAEIADMTPEEYAAWQREEEAALDEHCRSAARQARPASYSGPVVGAVPVESRAFLGQCADRSHR